MVEQRAERHLIYNKTTLKAIVQKIKIKNAKYHKYGLEGFG